MGSPAAYAGQVPRRTMLFPKRRKYRRDFRGTIKGVAQRGVDLSFGDWGLKALGSGWITARQIEAARRAVAHHTKRSGKFWIRIFPDKPVTKKPAETRMGKGKGSVEYWVAVVKPGRILFEIEGVPKETAQEAIRLACHKLPIKAKFVSRTDFGV